MDEEVEGRFAVSCGKPIMQTRASLVMVRNWGCIVVCGTLTSKAEAVTGGRVPLKAQEEHLQECFAVQHRSR
jgi:hypothetical protein